MRNSLLHTLFPLAALVATPALAAVDVSFTNPDSYTDIEASNGGERKDTLDELSRHMKRLGDRYLTHGETLAIEVLDVDLAGRVRWTASARPLRIVNDRGDAPMIQLRYTLASGGQVIDRRDETLTDPGFLAFHGFTYQNESLPYEKRMLDRWFRERFAEKRAER
jgi:hypothetical protein